MSSIWTPSGEHPTGSDPPEGRSTGDFATDDGDLAHPGGEEITPEMAAEILRARAELAAVPVIDIIANHAVGLWQLAALHLTPDASPDGSPTEPRLEDARLAIDALAALVEGLGPRLDPHEESLREALRHLQLAYVQVVMRADPDAQS